MREHKAEKFLCKIFPISMTSVRYSLCQKVQKLTGNTWSDNSFAPYQSKKLQCYSVPCCGVLVGPTGILLTSLGCFFYIQVKD